MQVHTSDANVDDSYLQVNTYESYLTNINGTIIMSQSLGFALHSEKFETYVFQIDRIKKEKVYDLSTKLFEKSKPTIRFLAHVIGNIVAIFLAVPLVLFY